MLPGCLNDATFIVVYKHAGKENVGSQLREFLLKVGFRASILRNFKHDTWDGIRTDPGHAVPASGPRAASVGTRVAS